MLWTSRWVVLGRSAQPAPSLPMQASQVSKLAASGSAVHK